MALPKLQLGVNIISNRSTIAADLALAKSLGFGWARVSFEMPWSADNSIGDITYAVSAAMNAGMKLIQCCQGMPASLARGERAGHYGPKDAASATIWGEWCAHVASIVALCKGATSCGNEWDGYGWDTTPSAGDCALLHAAALEARDKYAPGSTFVTCEMAPGSSPEPLAFLQAICVLAPTVLTDDNVWIGWHPYVDPRYAADYDALWNALHRMRDVHKWLVLKHRAKKKIMGGEWGIPNGQPGNVRSLSVQGVADYVRDQYLPAFEKQRADGVSFGPLCWFTLRDHTPTTPDVWTNYAGLVDVHGALKPIAGVLADYSKGTAA